MHTFKLNRITGPRFGEYNIKSNFDEYKLLCNNENPHTFKYHDQHEIEQALEFERYYTQPDPWSNNYSSAKYFILSQFSKKQATVMMLQSHKQFDAVVFLRPDVKYINPFPVDYLNKLDDKTCFFPNWHLYGINRHKVNDRFQMTKTKFAEKIGMSFDTLLAFSKTNKIHSETFMSHICMKNAIQCKYIDNYIFLRTRADGKVVDIDTKLLDGL